MATASRVLSICLIVLAIASCIIAWIGSWRAGSVFRRRYKEVHNKPRSIAYEMFGAPSDNPGWWLWERQKDAGLETLRIP